MVEKGTKNGQNHVTIQMLADAREMLVNARKLQKTPRVGQGLSNAPTLKCFR